MTLRFKRPPGRAFALALIAALALPVAAEAAIGDLTPLPGFAQCNAATGSFAGVCTPGSPLGGTPGSPGSGSRHVLVSPDGKHAYVISAASDQELGRIGVFNRFQGGSLAPIACTSVTLPTPAPPQTPPCVSSGNTDVDNAFAFGTTVNRAAMSPDGKQLFIAGQRLAVLDRNAATGVLTGRQVLSPAQTSMDVAVSPDGFNVYEGSSVASKSRLNVYARALNGNSVQIQCLNADGSGGCQKLGGAATFAHVRVSPDGANVYVSDSRTLVPLVRNADGRVAPILDSSGFGKQAGCMSFHASGIGCLSTQVPGLEIDELELSPDGVHVYAGSHLFRRDAATGKLSAPTAAPVSHTTGIALSPDGRSVYYGEGVNGTRVLGFAREPGTQQLTPLPAPLGCLSSNGGGGCQTAVGGPGFRGAMAFDPSGATFYVPSGLVSSATTRNFSRVAAPPLPPLVVGRATLSPRRSTVRDRARLTLTWEHPRNWNDLARLELRLRDGGRPMGRVVFDKRSGRVRGVGLRLVRGAFHGNGPAGRKLTLNAVVALSRPGRLIVDAIAADRGGRRQTIHQVGELTVRR